MKDKFREVAIKEICVTKHVVPATSEMLLAGLKLVSFCSYREYLHLGKEGVKATKE